MVDYSLLVAHIDETAAFLKQDTQDHMPPGSAANRALQFQALAETRAFLTGAAAPGSGAYQNLKDRFAVMARLAEIQSTLLKDADLFMPEAEATHRQEIITSFGAIGNLLIADAQVAQWLDAAETAKSALPADDRRNLALMRRHWVHEASLSAEMAGELARLDGEGEDRHTAFRADGDWSKMKDWYAHAFDLMRRVGEIKKNRLGAASVYEALMDSFSPGLKDTTVTAEFDKIEKALPGMIREATALQALEPAVLPLPRATLAQQEELSRRIARAMCFDFNRGWLAMTQAHPSCATISDDTRFTVDCIEDNFMEAVMTTAHECWHGRYAQNLPAAWRHQPVGADLGMTMHEAMSQIGELYAGRSPAFFRFVEKEAREIFNLPDDPALSAENLERYVTRVKPSFVRIYADEITYPAHIIRDTKLEKGIIEGTIDMADFLTAFDDLTETLLGIRPPNPREGGGQDSHIPTGYIGYKPAYLLSRLVLAQLAAAASRDGPAMAQEFVHGDFAKAAGMLDDWLRENVQGKGALLAFDDLLRQATGEKLNARYYLDDLSRRYLGKPFQPSGIKPAADNRPGLSPP